MRFILHAQDALEEIRYLDRIYYFLNNGPYDALIAAIESQSSKVDEVVNFDNFNNYMLSEHEQYVELCIRTNTHQKIITDDTSLIHLANEIVYYQARALVHNVFMNSTFNVVSAKSLYKTKQPLVYMVANVER